MTQRMIRIRVSEDDPTIDDEDAYYIQRHGTPLTGIIEERFEDGSIRFETEYSSGSLDGVGRVYFPSGAVRNETWHVAGIKRRHRWWAEDGSPELDWIQDGRGTVHRHDAWKEDGTHGSWRRSEVPPTRWSRFAARWKRRFDPPEHVPGLLRNVHARAADLRIDGEDVAYLDGQRFSGIAEEHGAGGRVIATTEYVGGMRDGLEWRYFTDGEVEVERWYDRGVLMRERSWYADGQMRMNRLIDAEGLVSEVRYAADGTLEHHFHRG